VSEVRCSICLGKSPSHHGLCEAHQRETGHRVTDGFCFACKKAVSDTDALPEGERIAAAAICMNKNRLVLSLPRPARHCDVIRVAAELGLPLLGNNEQGFLTSDGRFVRRAPARVIAHRAGQIGDEIIGGTLTSEDLW
jgi:hypothetical protein